VNDISVGNGGIEGDLASRYDLLSYYAEDIATDQSGLKRQFTYDVYNSGDKTILPSQRWSIIYLLYNATNANDYKIMLEDYYTDEYYNPAYPDSLYGYYDETDAWLGGFWNYFTVAPGKIASEGYYITYTMPNNITGKYYLVVMADAFNVISEANEDNNFYFITAENGKPLEFENGKILNQPPSAKSGKIAGPPARFSNTENQTVVKPGNLNAYTPPEIRSMLLHDKKTGKLDMKMKDARVGGMNGIKVKK
jgi:hypothetical protein